MPPLLLLQECSKHYFDVTDDLLPLPSKGNGDAGLAIKSLIRLMVCSQGNNILVQSRARGIQLPAYRIHTCISSRKQDPNTRDLTAFYVM